ncbi:MAG: T9SS type A sorting domain-containing protein [Fluviicola sp.]
MKKITILLAGLLLSTSSFAQTVLYSEDFESGGGSVTLNTSDVSSTAGTSGTNYWLINNSYTGGTGTLICFGSPFNFTVTNTPTQPGGITNAPTSTYLHTVSNAAVSNGITNSSFQAADGFCAFAENNFVEMTNDISTTGYTNVNIDFWWMCGGSATIFGELYYSTDGGTTWNLDQTNLNNQGAWLQSNFTNALWDNQATLRFGFRFVNGTTTAASEPGFSIDDIVVEGTSGGGGSNTITTGTSLTPASWCEGNTTTIQVDFTSTGTFNAGNVYTAELSDATGSFAAPTNIGTLTSTANSGVITAVIPGATPAGNGYRIRVVSDNPATIGSDNGSNLVINALPTVTQAPFSDVCSTGGVVNLVGGSPSGGSYSGTGTSGTQFDPSVSGVGSFPLTYTYTDGNGCSNSAVENITVIQGPTVTLSAFNDVCDTDAFFTLTGGNPSNGTYSGPGVTGGVFDPAAAGVGTHTITYSFTDGNGCDGTANETITVNDCANLNEESLISFEISPNPTNNTFQIVSQSVIDHVSLLDMSGRVIKEFDGSTAEFSVQELPSGVYMVRVSSQGMILDQRLMKQ